MKRVEGTYIYMVRADTGCTYIDVLLSGLSCLVNFMYLLKYAWGTTYGVEESGDEDSRGSFLPEN